MVGDLGPKDESGKITWNLVVEKDKTIDTILVPLFDLRN